MRKREKGNWVLGLMDKVFFKDEKVMMWWEYEKDDEQRFGNKYVLKLSL